jgi:drug/metabolite transporter (DMT)-like permease
MSQRWPAPSPRYDPITPVIPAKAGTHAPHARAALDPGLRRGDDKLMSERHARTSTIIAFAIVSLVWGSTWLVIKYQISAIPPGWTITWRFLVASVAMIVLTLVRGESLRLGRRGQIVAMLLGLLQFCANYQFVYFAELHLTSGIVAVIYALLLVPNAALSAVLLKTPVSGRFMAGSLVAILGIVLLLLHEGQHASMGGAVGLGVALSMAGLLAASGGNVLQASRFAEGIGGVPLMAWAMIWGAAIDAAIALVFDGAPSWDPQPHYWAGVAYLAIIGSVVTFPLYHFLIRGMGAGPAAYTSVVTPVVAMGLSTAFEGYRWDGLAAGGAVLAMAGLLIALGGRRKARGMKRGEPLAIGAEDGAPA